MGPLCNVARIFASWWPVDAKRPVDSSWELDAGWDWDWDLDSLANHLVKLSIRIRVRKALYWSVLIPVLESPASSGGLGHSILPRAFIFPVL